MNSIQRVGRLIAAVVTGIMCLVLVGAGLFTYRDTRALDDHGVTLEVPIMDHKLTMGAKGGVNYEITYAFTAPAQPQPISVVHHQPVTEEAYDRLQVGQVIRVQYLPENPTTTRMLEPGSTDNNLSMAVLAVFLGAITVLLVYLAVR